VKLNPPVVTRLGDLVQSFVADNEVSAEARKSGIPRGPVTGLYATDQLLGGFLAQGLHSAGRAGRWENRLRAADGSFMPLSCALCHHRDADDRTVPPIGGTHDRKFLGKLKSGELGAEQARELAEETVQSCRIFPS
jgi:hypothetical protein